MNIPKRNTDQGFTLIELLVVVAIIGLLSSIVLASLAGARSKARDTKRISEMRSIEKALTLYSLSNNGGVPLSAYTGISGIPPASNGTIDCNNAGLVANNDNLYDTLIAAKALGSKPAKDPQAAQGYCYIYLTNTANVAGAAYDANGQLISIGGPIAAVITSKVNSAVFAVFLENTKTFSGYQALAGISYGSSLPIYVNIDFTTGIKNDVSYTFGGGGSGGSGSGY